MPMQTCRQGQPVSRNLMRYVSIHRLGTVDKVNEFRQHTTSSEPYRASSPKGTPLETQISYTYNQTPFIFGAKTVRFVQSFKAKENG